jgi:hypothetical protein
LAAFSLAVFTVGTSLAGGALFWKDWPEGTAKGVMPPCGTNVLALGGDDILQATVETYCAIKPGQYVSFINPKAMDTYKKKGKKYPDGMTGVLQFADIGVAFTTEIKGGALLRCNKHEGRQVHRFERGQPSLNPKTCETCHATFNGVCKGFVCGNRM